MFSYFAILPVLSALFCIVLALFTVSRNKSHPANIGFALGLVSLAVMQAGDAILLLSGNNGDAVIRGIQLSMTGQNLLPVTWIVFSITFARTNHKEILLKWIPIIIGMSLISLFFIYNIYWTEAQDFLMPSSDEVSWSHPVKVGPMGRSFYIYLILGLVLNLAHLEATFRSSSGSKRWQIKYIILGVGAIFSFLIYMSSQTLLFSSIDLQSIPVTSAVILLSVTMMALFIVRHRLLDVDIFVSRYIVYNSVTVLVVGLYLLCVGVVAQLIKYFDIPFSYFFATFFIFVSVVALLILLFSTTVRRKVQLFINRHFYKHKYEFRDKWMETIEKICSKRGVREVNETVIDMIRETMGASKAVLWLYEPVSGRYSQQVDNSDNNGVANNNPFIQRIKNEMAPFAIDKSGGLQNDKLADVDAVLCAPLITDGEVVGFMLLGEDISGEPYRQDDFQLLTAVTTQAAVQIKNIRLAQELMTAKEVEAFHRMSSFIMHDLKNLTNSLSLVSQNAKHHINNPDFQQDAIKTIDSTVSRMKGLIERLSTAPTGSELKREMVNVRDLMDRAAGSTGLTDSTGIAYSNGIDRNLLIHVDPEAMEMVFLNIIKNSQEALHGSGVITVDATGSDEWIDVAISDNGPGISQEFIENSLFRPFKSAKKGGFGIGLYQCKAVIEAHGGSIAVESGEGMGTKFVVKLPKGRV